MNKVLLFLVVIVFFTNLFSQSVQEQWVNTVAEDGGRKVLLDNNNNIYILTVYFSIFKYNSAGELLWTTQYENAYGAVDCKLDQNDNLYVTGLKYNESNFLDMITISYSSEGDILWERIYETLEWVDNISPISLEIDNIDDIIILASLSNNTPSDFYKKGLIIKYNSIGTQLWETFIEPITDNWSQPCGIKTDIFRNIYIVGEDGHGPGFIDMTSLYIIKLNNSGQLQWQQTYEANQFGCSLALTNQEDGIFVTALNSYESFRYLVVLKYSADGELLWNQIKQTWAWVRKVSVDSEDNLIIASFGTSENDIFKFDEDGEEIWEIVSEVAPKDLIIDQNDFFYITGKSNNDCATVKFDSAGNQEWIVYYNSLENLSDGGNSIVLDNTDNFYVVGYSTIDNLYNTCITIKYSEITNYNSNLLPKSYNEIYVYPNPFNPSTTINFEIIKPGNIDVNIYNIKGQQIKQLLNGCVQKGLHNIIWNGKNDSGFEVSSGQYFVNLKQNDNSVATKMLLQK
ncbi:MAG: T9SS type A sorting domain-containing protein [Candidatus Cloacimonetes bacterium]|nr:T9SS type A sorting domain-containing protein [Candidatus Cloacimonadota bacterium]